MTRVKRLVSLPKKGISRGSGAVERECTKVDEVSAYALNERDCRRTQLVQYFGQQGFDARLQCRGTCSACATQLQQLGGGNPRDGDAASGGDGGGAPNGTVAADRKGEAQGAATAEGGVDPSSPQMQLWLRGDDPATGATLSGGVQVPAGTDAAPKRPAPPHWARRGSRGKRGKR